jgi:hypothetical protein
MNETVGGLHNCAIDFYTIEYFNGFPAKKVSFQSFIAYGTYRRYIYINVSKILKHKTLEIKDFILDDGRIWRRIRIRTNKLDPGLGVPKS